MIHDFFNPEQYRHKITGSTACVPSALYPQMFDWTCSIACIRSITSGIIDMPDDITLVKSLNLKPGPYYSKDLKALNILDNKHLEVSYGCDDPNQDILDPSDIWLLLHDGWRVMANWMMSRDHWTVMMGYLVTEENQELNQILYYCPYFNEIRTVRTGDFECMWNGGGQSNIIGQPDYIAVRAR